jgi:hypothetical protein
MKRVIVSFLATALCSIGAAFAADMQEPTEVGTTTMPPGEYDMVHKGSHKTYTLMVTSKGMMIMAPDKDGVNAAVPPAAVVPAAGAAVTTTAAPALTAPVVPAQQASATQIATPGKSLLGNDMVKGIMQQGMKEGMNQLGKFGAKGQINKLLK